MPTTTSGILCKSFFVTSSSKSGRDLFQFQEAQKCTLCLSLFLAIFGLVMTWIFDLLTSKSNQLTFVPKCTKTINPLKDKAVNWLHFLGLTYICNFWHSGTLVLSPECQSARMSEITNAGYIWREMALNNFKCDHLMSLHFKGLIWWNSPKWFKISCSQTFGMHGCRDDLKT